MAAAAVSAETYNVVQFEVLCGYEVNLEGKP
jgi:hypothetical protein